MVFGSGKTKSWFNLTIHKPDIDKTCLYVKDPYEAKYELLINKERENKGLIYLNGSNAFTEHLNDTDIIYKNIEEYNPKKEKFLLFSMTWVMICLVIKILIQ